jgi:hypothetical protein
VSHAGPSGNFSVRKRSMGSMKRAVCVRPGIRTLQHSAYAPAALLRSAGWSPTPASSTGAALTGCHPLYKGLETMANLLDITPNRTILSALKQMDHYRKTDPSLAGLRAVDDISSSRPSQRNRAATSGSKGHVPKS